MILPFKPQFIPKILDGPKIHTLRDDPHRRWHPGRAIHMATGVRTKYYHCFNQDVCTAVQEVYIAPRIMKKVFMAGHFRPLPLKNLPKTMALTPWRIFGTGLTNRPISALFIGLT